MFDLWMYTWSCLGWGPWGQTNVWLWDAQMGPLYTTGRGIRPSSRFYLENFPNIVFPEQTWFLWFFCCFAGKSAKWSTLFHSKINLPLFCSTGNYSMCSTAVSPSHFHKVCFPLWLWILLCLGMIKSHRSLGFHLFSFVTSYSPVSLTSLPLSRLTNIH